MSDGPKRTTTEPTLVIPKDSLPPADKSSDDITLEEHMRLRREAPTLVPCPWCDNGMVTHEKRQEWLAAYPELASKEPQP